MSFSALLDVLLSDPNLGIDVVYRPLMGAPVPCRAAFANPDIEQQLATARVRARKRWLIVKSADVAQPSKDDMIEIPVGGAEFRVLNFSANDPMRLTWRIEVAAS